MNWILLRGLGRDQRHWLDFPDKLKQNDDHIHCLDLPGFGTEDKHTSPLSISGHVSFLRSRFSKLSINGPKTLIGISLGGMIALDWAARFSEDFDRVVVINASSKELSSLIQRLSLYAIYRVIRSTTAGSVKKRELQILKMISHIKQNDPVTLASMITLAQTSPIDIKNLSRQLFAASQFICPNRIDIPLLILASLKDRMVDVRCSKAIAEKLAAPIKFHPTAGHDLTLDDPEWAAQHIQDFIKDASAHS